ncbi:MAG: helix-turn-helix transcriptional regulator [Clostridium sp.]|nr:helix-turn-helix transcriptional regulator [Clostridium sp.]
MNLGEQIRKYRTELSLSQDQLAEKLFVSRQSVSNWENDKTYPDIKSLLLLSELFSVSLDQLVKGDVEIMKQEINEQDRADLSRKSAILSILFLAILLLPIPLARFFGWWGLLIYLMIWAVSFWYASEVEKYKKRLDIQTYREIVAFMEGRTLSEIEKARESGKRIYQKIFLAVGSALLAVIVCAVMYWLIG